MTGEYTPDVARRLGGLGVSTCFEKPFDYDEVTRRIREELDDGPGVIDLFVGRFFWSQRRRPAFLRRPERLEPLDITVVE